MEIPSDIVYYIAGQIESNIRVLEGALNRVIAYSTLNNCLPTIDIATRSAQGLLFHPEKADHRPDLIKQIVAENTA